METAIIIFLGALGATLGSFVGALTWRIHKKMNYVSDRSECENCHHKLNGLDLIPIFSWLSLKGRCRYCKKPIGTTTLWLEVGLASVFIASYVFWPFGSIMSSFGIADFAQISMFMLWLIALVLLAALFTYDLRWSFLPDKFMWPLAVVAGVLSVSNNIFVQHNNLLIYILNVIFAMIPVAGVYLLLYVISNKKWIGFGDVKFGIVVGLLLSWQGSLMVLVIANMIGSIVMVPLLASKKLKLNSEIPFGPFLIAATVFVFLFYPQLINWTNEFLLLN